MPYSLEQTLVSTTACAVTIRSCFWSLNVLALQRQIIAAVVSGDRKGAFFCLSLKTFGF